MVENIDRPISKRISPELDDVMHFGQIGSIDKILYSDGITIGMSH